MIRKAFKYELFPTQEQQMLLEQHFGSCRYIYNWGLEQKIKAYESNQKISCFDLIKKLTELKNEEKHLWLKDVYSQSLQMSLRNLDNAFTTFFKAQNNFPKFKSKHNNRKSYQCPQKVKIDFENNLIQIPMIKKVKAAIHRQFEGIIRTCTISKTPTNRYFISMLVEIDENLPDKPEIIKETSIGIDLGIKDYAITSNNQKFENPKYLRQSEQRLKVLQRRFSKSKKGTKRREKLKLLLAKQYEKVTNQRKDFLHKLTYKLTHENQVNTICIEDLNVKGMLKNHCLSKSISDASWSKFVEFLTYKCEWYGKNLITIGRFEPSSKICSNCGNYYKELKLSERFWKCSECNEEHDRDVNAAKNIRNFGLIPKLGIEDTVSSINKAFLNSEH
jgi:putative transposase